MNTAFPILLAFLFAFGLASCVSVRPKPPRMDSDPNVQEQKQLQDKLAEENIEVFIAEHPEFDDQTKADLRSGAISRDKALAKPKPK